MSGPAARDYIVPALFEQAGIGLSFYDYSGYPTYDQVHPPFDHAVSVIDLIGHRARSHQRHRGHVDVDGPEVALVLPLAP